MKTECRYREKTRPGTGWLVRNLPDGAHEGGFTLVELLVAVFILAVVVYSLYSGYAFGFTVIRVSQENVRASQLAAQKLETLRIYGWSQTASNNFIPANFITSYAPGAASPGTSYTGRIAIASAPVTESYASTLRQATVTLTWASGGVLRTRSMTTFISQYGIQTY
jgi:prepilin-type N-terminal cleavage/methylation domain-containing protein